MRALFDYDPAEDTLLPCKEIGLGFSHGDILQVLFLNFYLSLNYFVNSFSRNINADNQRKRSKLVASKAFWR